MTLDTPARPRLRRRTATSQAPVQVAGTPAPTPAPPRLPGRRNPRWIALGVLALVLGGLLSWVLYSRVATESAVIAVAATVYRGEVIEAADLTTVTVNGAPGVKTIPASELDHLVGQRAGFDLVAGALLTPGSTTSAAMPAKGRAIIGLKVAQGRAPMRLLLPGTPVRLVALPPAGAGTGSGKDPLTGRTYFAVIVDTADAADGTSSLVNVEVGAVSAADVASLGAQDRIAVLRDAG